MDLTSFFLTNQKGNGQLSMVETRDMSDEEIELASLHHRFFVGAFRKQVQFVVSMFHNYATVINNCYQLKAVHVNLYKHSVINA